MKKTFAEQEKTCLLCGIGTWVLFGISMFLMNFLDLVFSYLFALLWVGSSLGAVILAVGIRCEIGRKKNVAVRWGMLLGTVMLAIQGFLVSLLIFQGQWKWESFDAGVMSLLVALFLIFLCLFFYLFFGRRGQLRLEQDWGRKGDCR